MTLEPDDFRRGTMLAVKGADPETAAFLLDLERAAKGRTIRRFPDQGMTCVDFAESEDLGAWLFDWRDIKDNSGRVICRAAKTVTRRQR